MPSSETPDDGEFGMTIEHMAALSGQQPWMLARGVARLISRGLLDTMDGTREEAVASLQRRYGPAVTGE